MLSSLFEASRVPFESADSRGGCVDCKPCFWLVAAIVIHVFICWQHCQQMNNLVYSVVRLAALHAHSHVLTHTACRAAVPDLTSTEVKPFHNAGMNILQLMCKFQPCARVCTMSVLLLFNSALRQERLSPLNCTATPLGSDPFLCIRFGCNIALKSEVT